jgi:PKD repeat protein
MSNIVKPASVVFVVLLVVSQPAAVASVSAAGNGEFSVDVELPDGTTATEVNALLIYQAGQSDPFRKVENYPSVDVEHVFSNLPTGHDYRVTAYIQDQYVGDTEWVSVSNDKIYTPGDESSVSRTITAERRVPVSIKTLHDDGSTALEGAQVSISSHEGEQWRSGVTDSDGVARSPEGGREFYLYPADGAGSYTVEVSYDGATVATRTLSTLDSARDLEITTSEPVPTYSLSVSSTEGGDVDAEQTNGIEEGETVSIEANADAGYVFDHWEGDVPSGDREDTDISVTMTEDKDLEAHFVDKPEVTFTVSKESTIQGYGFSGDPIEDARVEVDGVARYTDDDGKVQFDLAPGDQEFTVTADGYESSTRTVNVPDTGGLAVSVGLVRDDAGGLTVDVVDRDGNDVAANKYRVLADGERLELNAEGEAILDAGTYDITVEPTDFGGDELKTVSKTVTIEAGEGSSVELMPMEIPTYSLEVDVPGSGGGVSVNPPGVTSRGDLNRRYEQGEEITLTAEPAEGYKFDHWEGDIPAESRNSPEVGFEMNADRSVHATFAREKTVPESVELRVDLPAKREGEYVVVTGQLVSTNTQDGISGETIEMVDYNSGILNSDQVLAETKTGPNGGFQVRWKAKKVDDDTDVEMYVRHQGGESLGTTRFPKNVQYPIQVTPEPRPFNLTMFSVENRVVLLENTETNVTVFPSQPGESFVPDPAQRSEMPEVGLRTFGVPADATVTPSSRPLYSTAGVLPPVFGIPVRGYAAEIEINSNSLDHGSHTVTVQATAFDNRLTRDREIPVRVLERGQQSARFIAVHQLRRTTSPAWWAKSGVATAVSGGSSSDPVAYSYEHTKSLVKSIRKGPKPIVKETVSTLYDVYKDGVVPAKRGQQQARVGELLRMSSEDSSTNISVFHQRLQETEEHAAAGESLAAREDATTALAEVRKWRRAAEDLDVGSNQPPWRKSAKTLVVEQLRQVEEYLQAREKQLTTESDTAIQISNVDPPSGEFQVGDEVISTVTVQNKADTIRAFFVGYSAIGPTGTSYDNGNETGKSITLDPSEQRTVPLSWQVQSTGPNGDPLPSGTYDLAVAVWNESDRENLERRLDQQVTEDQITVQTTSQQRAPVIEVVDVSPSAVAPGGSVAFDATATDPDGTVQSYEWDFDGDGTTDATGQSTTHTFGAARTYQVTLTVTDDSGAFEEATRTVTVVGDDGSVSARLDTTDGRVEVYAREEQEITGHTNAEPGAELSLRVNSQSDTSPFLTTLETTVQSGGGPDALPNSFTFTGDFSNRAAGIDFEATVRRSGEPVSDAYEGRILFAARGSVSIASQAVGESEQQVVVDSVTLSDGGFVAIHRDSADGSLLGHSRYLEAGRHSAVQVPLETAVAGETTAAAVPYLDEDGDGSLAPTGDDRPYTDSYGPVSDRAIVTAPAGDDPGALSAQNGVAIDGDTAYVVDSGAIHVVDLVTDEVTTEFEAPDGNANGLAYGNGSLWFADGIGPEYDGEIVELDPESGAVRSRIDTSYDPAGLAYGEGSLWVTDITFNNVVEYTSEGTEVSQFDTRGPTGSTWARALAHADGSVWVGTDENGLHEFAVNGTYVREVEDRAAPYGGLGANGTTLFGPGPNGAFTDLRTVATDEPVQNRPAVARSFDAAAVAPGGNVSVTANATARSESLTLTESFSPAVANGAVESVTVEGETVRPTLAEADADGVAVAVDGLSPGDHVSFEYTVSVPDTAEVGAEYTVSGSFTGETTASLGTDAITIADASPLDGVAGEYDSNGDGEISITELGTAASKYAAGDLSITGLGTVAQAYAAS